MVRSLTQGSQRHKNKGIKLTAITTSNKRSIQEQSSLDIKDLHTSWITDIISSHKLDTESQIMDHYHSTENTFTYRFSLLISFSC